jgi:hypothetical protein
MPKDKMGWHKIKVFPKAMIRLLAAKHIPVFKKRVQKGIDGDGKRFKGYTKSYRKYKRTGFKSFRGTGKRIESMEGIVLSSNRGSPPDLTLTGDMLKNLKRKKFDKDSYIIGFTGEDGDKVEWNKDMGRNIIDDIPNQEKKFLVKLLDKQMQKQFKRKLKNVTITIGN